MMNTQKWKSFTKDLATLALLVAAFLLLTSYASAQDDASNTPPTVDPDTSSKIDTLKQGISDRQVEIKQLEQEIAAYSSKLVDVGNQKSSLQNQIKTIDLTRAKLAADMKLTQVKIANTSDAILKLSTNIDQKEQHIQKDKGIIADIIHRVDQQDSTSMVESILGRASISDVIQDVDDLTRLQASVRDSIASLQTLKDELGTQKSSFESQQKQLVLLKAQLSDQKILADQQRVEQARLLSDTKNQESNYKKLLADKQARKKQFEREIDDYEAQLRAVIDPNSFPRPGTKVLSYPVDNVRITQRFGRTVDSVRLYAAGTHNGVDFAASQGTPIKAVADGVVETTGDTDAACRGASYGRFVFIRHKNGLASIYGHLSLIKVGAGQEVSTGDIIGYSGATGYATGPHLHLGLFVSSAVNVVNLPSKSCAGAVFRIPVAPLNAYLDPLSYM
jgi:murein DD-endopeptidase MepM/ murein hydrolase activator NlpD